MSPGSHPHAHLFGQDQGDPDLKSVPQQDSVLTCATNAEAGLGGRKARLAVEQLLGPTLVAMVPGNTEKQQPGSSRRVLPARGQRGTAWEEHGRGPPGSASPEPQCAGSGAMPWAGDPGPRGLAKGTLAGDGLCALGSRL